MQNERLKLGKDFLVIAIITLITVIGWIALEIYRASQQNTIPQPTTQQMKSLNPKLKKEVFDDLKQRYDPTQEEINQAIESNQKILPTNVATSSSNQATESGNLN